MLDLAMGPKLMVCHDLKVKRGEGRRRDSVRERERKGEREKREKERETERETERGNRGEREAMGCTGGSLYTIRSTPYYPQVALSPPLVFKCNYFLLLPDIPSSLHHGNRATTAMTVSPRVCGAPSRCPTQSRRGNASTRSCTTKNSLYIQCSEICTLINENLHTET